MVEAKSGKPAGRRELRKRERRTTIIEAARQSFFEHGYAATSMSGLLDTLGGSKATLWGYFRSKEELFAAVIDDASEAFRVELEAAVSLDGDLGDGVTRFCRCFMAAIESPDAVALWRLIVTEGTRFPELSRIFYARAAQFPEAILTAFLQRHAGSLREQDPRRMAVVLVTLCIGRQDRLILGGGIAPADPVEAAASEFTALFLRAYGNPAGA